jgi:hypothetical protein
MNTSQTHGSEKSEDYDVKLSLLTEQDMQVYDAASRDQTRLLRG